MKVLLGGVLGLAIGAALVVASLLYRRSAKETTELDDSFDSGDYGPIVSEYRIGRVSASVH